MHTPRHTHMGPTCSPKHVHTPRHTHMGPTCSPKHVHTPWHTHMGPTCASSSRLKYSMATRPSTEACAKPVSFGKHRSTRV